MKRAYVWILLTLAALITMYGIISGKFFFLFFMLPLGFSFFNRKNQNDED